MSDYVLNRASFEPPLSSLNEAQHHLILMLRGLAALDQEEGPLPTLRMHDAPWNIPVVAGNAGESVSMFDAVDRLYGSANHSVAEYFSTLQSMFPTDSGFADAQIDTILAAEESSPLAGFEDCHDSVRAAGLDAMICAISQSVLSSLPRGTYVHFDRMGFQNDGVEYSFDHVALPEHGIAINARSWEATRRGVTRNTLWRLKEKVFCNLLFGEDVREQIDRFAPHLFNLMLSRLDDLNRRAGMWPSTINGSFPSSGCLIRPESALTMNDYGNTRRFRGHDGEMRLFEEHVWIDRGSRIHLFRDFASRTVEIGYIGPHLPTATFGT